MKDFGIYLSFGLPDVSWKGDDFCCGDLVTGVGGGGRTTSYVGGGTWWCPLSSGELMNGE